MANVSDLRDMVRLFYREGAFCGFYGRYDGRVLVGVNQITRRLLRLDMEYELLLVVL